MISQVANKVDNELRFIGLKVERAHTGILYKGARVIRTLSAGALHHLPGFGYKNVCLGSRRGQRKV
jgi:hypothetical protein